MCCFWSSFFIIQSNQCIVLLIHIKILDQSLPQETVEIADTILKLFHVVLFNP
nr:hypothetical protein Iba_chr08cCG14900 [Ipomoea batatas]